MPDKLIFPQSNLGPASAWGRKMEDVVRELDRIGKRNDASAERGQQGGASTLNGLQKQIAGLKEVADEQAKILVDQGFALAEIEALQEDQAALQQVYYNEFNNISGEVSGFIGFFPGTTPSVTLTTKSGRMQIDFGGALNGGNGYFCYSVTSADSSGIVWVDRSQIVNNAAQRVAVSGGASFAPSGFRTTVVEIPPGRRVVVRLHLWAENANVTFFGGNVLVRALP